jgi:uncharacterized membrane protein
MNKNINIKLFFCSIIVIFLLTSCENNVEEVTKIDKTSCDPAISFSNNVKPIIDNNCIECHYPGNQFPDLTNYNSISNNATSIKTAVVNRIMPLGGTLTNAEIELIRCWIDNGKPNN